MDLNKDHVHYNLIVFSLNNVLLCHSKKYVLNSSYVS